ncbi:MAG: hypothetical protein ACP5NS_00320 [Candidatus Pacearchaeota archaeon]
MKKKFQKIPKSVMLKCPACASKSKALVSIVSSPQSYICPKCNVEVRNPLTQCCVICAFSGKLCPRNLYMYAKVNGLELR